MITSLEQTKENLELELRKSTEILQTKAGRIRSSGRMGRNKCGVFVWTEGGSKEFH